MNEQNRKNGWTPEPEYVFTEQDVPGRWRLPANACASRWEILCEIEPCDIGGYQFCGFASPTGRVKIEQHGSTCHVCRTTPYLVGQDGIKKLPYAVWRRAER